LCRVDRPRESTAPAGIKSESGVLPVDPELKRNAKNVIEKIHQLRDSL
jgi:hypothetical protein